jgi:hypothetical protein
MKRIATALCFLLALVLVLFLAGCPNDAGVSTGVISRDNALVKIQPEEKI